jgi:hypothetical protein
MYVSTLGSAGNGPRWRFRVRQAAAKILLHKNKYVHSIILAQDGVSKQLVQCKRLEEIKTFSLGHRLKIYARLSEYGY